LLASAAVFLDLYQAASLINFGAFVAFAFVNLSVVATYIRFPERRSARAAAEYVLLPILGVAVNIWLWLQLESSAKLLGAVWVALGLGFLLWRTRLFRAPAPVLTGPEAE
jgi:putrescine importer